MLDDSQTNLSWAKSFRTLLMWLATSADEPPNLSIILSREQTDCTASIFLSYVRHLRSALVYKLRVWVLRILFRLKSFKFYYKLLNKLLKTWSWYKWLFFPFYALGPEFSLSSFLQTLLLNKRTIRGSVNIFIIGL